MSLARPTVLPSLVESAAAGDQDALAQIMAAHDGDMARVCMVICGDVDTAREAVQAAWPIAWRKLGSLRDPARLRPWLVSVAANEARQIMRSDRRRTARERHLAPPAPADPGERSDYLDLAAAVSRLETDDRRLIGLRYVAGLSSAEIAREMGGTAAAVRGRLARAVQRLRRDLVDD